MERLQAAWLHQKFCKGRTLTHVTEPGGIIAEMFCTHCQISLWKIGDDAGLPIVGGHSEEYLKIQEKHLTPELAEELLAIPYGDEYDSERPASHPDTFDMNNPRAPYHGTRPYVTTSGEYDPLLGRCDLCKENSVFANLTTRLCKTHFERATRYREERRRLAPNAPIRCISEEECKGRVQYGSRDFFVTTCRRHFQQALILARLRGGELNGRW